MPTTQSSFNNLANPDKHVLVKAVPVLDSNGDQTYDENDRPICRLAIVPIGVIQDSTTGIDLSDYVTTTSLNTALANYLLKSGGTLTGALSGTTLTLTGTLTGTTATLSGALSAATTKESVQALSSGSIDCSLGSFFTKTVVAEEALTIALSNMQAGQVISIKLVNGGLGTITYPADWLWQGGEVPDLQADGTDLIIVSYDGTNYIANAVTELAAVPVSGE